MSFRKGIPLRVLLYLFVLLSVLITLAIALFVSYTNEKNSLKRTTSELNQVYAEKISEMVDSLFASMNQNLKVVGQYLQNDLDREDLSEQLRLFQQAQSNLDSIFIVNPEGVLIGSTTINLNNEHIVLNSVGAIQALNERRPLISEPYLSATDHLIVMISHPLSDEQGEYAGYIGGSIRLHETNMFHTLLGSMPFAGDMSYSYVVSSNGVLLYHPEEDRIGEKVEGNAVIEALKVGQSGTMEVVNSKNVQMISSYVYSPSSSWGIVSQTPIEVILTMSRDNIKNIALKLMPLLLILILLIYYIAGKLAEPLSKLAHYASGLSSKDAINEPMPEGNFWTYETKVLYQAFGTAVQHFRYQFDRLAKDAQTDALTGLLNRRSFDHFIELWMSQKAPFSIVILDLDKFKLVNDTYGHDVGDEVLKFFAAGLKNLLSEECICCRFGGEEFVVLVPSDDTEYAMKLAERVRQYMEETISPTGQIVTVSAGIASYPLMVDQAEQLLKLADDALYQAKNQGRNQVVSATVQSSKHSHVS